MHYLSAICIIIIAWFVTPVAALGADFTINNKFGIHLATPQDEDLDRARDLINSNGGNWGYITLVIQENDMSVDKWQGVFDKLREKRMIPIIRIATQPDGGNWRRPNPNEARKWAEFLNKLNWVVKERYVILFNEPNHATEWGGEVDAVSFAQVNEAFARKLKESGEHYFIMTGGLDASAPSKLPQYQDEAVFLRQLVETIGVDDYNRLFDGLSSHSYPNPGFIGSANGFGRGTVRTYQWELELLGNMGVKSLPVFITETGWHGQNLTREDVASRFRFAYEQIWLPDTRVVAVTPFILNYQSEPFLQFSWVKEGNGGVYPEYETVKSMLKRSGRPEIEQRGHFNYSLPKEIVEQSTYHFQIRLRNQGQAIWSHDEQYEVELDGIAKTRYLISTIGTVKPFDSRTFDVYLNTGSEIGDNTITFNLKRGDEVVLKSRPWQYTVVQLPSLTFDTSLFPKFITSGDDFEIQVFDEYEQLVFSRSGIEVAKGEGTIDKIENIALGTPYRVVLLKQHYLPRQSHIEFQKGENEVRFERMWPFDSNGDGAFTWSDFSAFFQNLKMITYWWPV